MIKKYVLLVLLTTHFVTAFSQKEENAVQGFDVNKMFAGGNIVLGYGGGSSSSQFTIGANPEIGYSIYKNLDLGLCFNIINQSGSYYDYYYGVNYKVKFNIFNFGMGIFSRLHITDRFFLHIQPEFNNRKYKASIENYNSSMDTVLKSTSILAGIGYGTRVVGNMNVFSLILIDLQNNLYSPYRNSVGQIIPQFRGGINWYFNRKKKN